MLEHHAKMGEDEHVLIPADFRRKLHLKPGGGGVLQLEDNTLRLVGLKHSIQHAQSLVQAHAKNRSLFKSLNKKRIDEAQQE